MMLDLCGNGVQKQKARPFMGRAYDVAFLLFGAFLFRKRQI